MALELVDSGELLASLQEDISVIMLCRMSGKRKSKLEHCSSDRREDKEGLDYSEM